jgi:hypothetical protein
MTATETTLTTNSFSIISHLAARLSHYAVRDHGNGSFSITTSAPKADIDSAISASTDLPFLVKLS